MENNNYEWMRKSLNSLMLTDGYKTSHHLCYPPGTSLIYSNFTGRSSRYAPSQCEETMVVFGTQLMLRQLHELFQINFFDRPKEEVCGEMKREMELYLNAPYDVSHFEELHDLGHLPIRVKSIDEGTLCPVKIPMLSICNTKRRFFWVTNYLETIISNLLWKPMVSASIARAYRRIFDYYQQKTDKNNSWITDFQGHDFSMRGMDSIEATISSGLGHLTSFKGTDSLPTLYAARKYYGEENFVGASVNATEHSVASSLTEWEEIEEEYEVEVIYDDSGNIISEKEL